MPKIKIGVFLFLFLFSSFAGAQEIVKSFTAPGLQGTWGLTWDGKYLWSASVFPGSNTIYHLDTNGTVLSSFFWSGGIVTGMAWDGNYLYLAEGSSGAIYKVDTLGQLQKKLQTSLNFVTGLTWDGINMWAIDRPNFTLNRLDSLGQVEKSLALRLYFPPCAFCVLNGLAWDGSFFWIADAFTNTIFAVDTLSVVRTSFTGPGTNATELEWDGRFLWVSDIVTDRIYQIRVPEIPVLEASAKIGFRPQKWNIAWLTEEPEESEGHINALIGEIKSPPKDYSPEDIVLESVFLNQIVPISSKKDCERDEEDDDDEYVEEENRERSNCFLAKIKKRQPGFEGRVLKAKFNKLAAIQSLGDIRSGDTVVVEITGMLKDGVPFRGSTQIIIHGKQIPTAVKERPERPIFTYQLLGNYPNPFNTSTLIKYSIQKVAYVNLLVYNILGERVKVLVDETKAPGEYSVLWDGRNDSGNEVASGVYFYILKAGDFTETRKMTLLK